MAPFLFFYYVTASKYDFPTIPMKLLNTTNMNRRQKDKIRKKQEKLDRTLETIGIEEKTFLEVFRDRPMEVLKANSFILRLDDERDHTPVPIHFKCREHHGFF